MALEHVMDVLAGVERLPANPNFNTCWAVETVPLTEVPFMYACWDVEFS